MKNHKDTKHYQEVAALILLQRSVVGQMRDIVKVTKMIPDADEIEALTEEFRELTLTFMDLAKKIKLLRDSGPKVKRIDLN